MQTITNLGCSHSPLLEFPHLATVDARLPSLIDALGFCRLDALELPLSPQSIFELGKYPQ